MKGILEERRGRSNARLDELVGRAEALESTLGDEPLCIYVTGSYGRGEAVSTGDLGRDSDLDLFFLYDSDDPAKALSKTTWFPLAGDLIRLVEHLGFPPFSGDAEYLEIHNVARMRQELGSPTDDSVNTFTARMLLLLESRPVLRRDVYEQLLERIIHFYFADFDEHHGDFRPTFLLNDILRFWRTLTLNYEHSRNKHREKEKRGDDDADPLWAVKSAEKNLKLGFSRLSTCFSMVVPLAYREPPVTHDDVLALTRLTPLERWETVDHAAVDRLFDLYEWFLSITADKVKLRDDLATEGSNEIVGTRDKDFGDLVFEILMDSPQRQTLRYVVV